MTVLGIKVLLGDFDEEGGKREGEGGKREGEGGRERERGRKGGRERECLESPFSSAKAQCLREAPIGNIGSNKKHSGQKITKTNINTVVKLCWKFQLIQLKKSIGDTLILNTTNPELIPVTLNGVHLD